MQSYQAIKLLDEMEVEQFLTERCLIDPDGQQHSQLLYEAYWGWARTPGAPRDARQVSHERFNECLRWRGFRQVVVSKLRYWDGVRLIEAA